jgi:transketolase
MLEAVFSGFGWATRLVDGHDVEELQKAFAWAAVTKGRPAIVIAKTIKGKGVKFMEGDFTWHSRVPTERELAAALRELEGETGESEAL